MPGHRVAVLVSIVAALAVPRLVRAMCASPAAAFSPASDAIVPPDPTLYFFLPRWHAGEHARVTAHARGVELPVMVRQLAATDAFVAYTVKVKTGDARALHVRSASGATARYRIDPRWRGPAKRTATPVAAVHRTHSWTCSFTNVWTLSIDRAAPALQVEWATSPTAFARGVATVAVFPTHRRVFWRWLGDAEEDSSPAVELGHGNCFGYTISRETVKGAGFVNGELFVRVTPLYADGSAGEPGAIVRVGELSRASKLPAP